jgi:hypothetical protein
VEAAHQPQACSGVPDDDQESLSWPVDVPMWEAWAWSSVPAPSSCTGRHERALLRRLAGVEGVSRLADVPAGPDTIALVDVGGVALRSRPLPLDVDQAVSLLTRLVGIVAEVHRHGVVAARS